MTTLRSTSPPIAAPRLPTAPVTGPGGGCSGGTDREVSGSRSTPIGLPRRRGALGLLARGHKIQFRSTHECDQWAIRSEHEGILAPGSGDRPVATSIGGLLRVQAQPRVRGGIVAQQLVHVV